MLKHELFIGTLKIKFLSLSLSLFFLLLFKIFQSLSRRLFYLLRRPCNLNQVHKNQNTFSLFRKRERGTTKDVDAFYCAMSGMHNCFCFFFFSITHCRRKRTFCMRKRLSRTLRTIECSEEIFCVERILTLGCQSLLMVFLQKQIFF